MLSRHTKTSYRITTALTTNPTDDHNPIHGLTSRHDGHGDERDLDAIRTHVAAALGTSRIRIAHIARADLGLGPHRWWRTGAYAAYGLFEMITTMMLPVLALAS
ncbi:hypothetical protein B4N89_30650 [Embleya scabrispora]|uniref:Uncharacterized protein n=1 Tax=Embleya scabrispora TaxID=159449 RepID=A0A1T3P754_9ACTN|nr:hypothetical protein [Embleya scabrispora]OPC84700.1 hypothetical protein B4N89_30650 [Embleya scabrispora]